MAFVLRKITKTLRRRSAPVRGFEVASPETLENVENFTRAVNNELDPATCQACVQLFVSQFASLDSNIYSQLDIAEPVTKLMRPFIAHLMSNLATYQPLDGGFLFLKVALTDYISDGLIENEVSLLIIQIFTSNLLEVLDASREFVKAAMMTPSISKVLFSDQFLVLIWENCYIGHEHTYSVFGSLCSEMVRYGNFSNQTDIAGFLKCVEGSLIEGQLQAAFAEYAFMFLTMVIYRVESGTFLEKLFPLMLPVLENMKNLKFFDFLIESTAVNVYLVIRIMEELLSNENLAISAIQSLLEVLQRSEASVHFNCTILVRQMPRFDEKQQDAIFGFVNRQSKEQKVHFACSCCPLDVTKVSPSGFSEFLMGNEWSDADFERLIDSFMIKNEKSLLQHMGDSGYMQISAYLLKHVTMNTDVYHLVYGWLSHFTEHQEITSYISIISHRGNRLMIARGMYDFVAAHEVSSVLFRYLADYALEFGELLDVFHEDGNMECLVKYLDLPECIDFIAALANNGPMAEVDRFVNEHFQGSPLSKLSKDGIMRLALGLRSDDDNEGQIRIPSLLKFIDKIPIRTLSEKRILAETNYYKLNDEEIAQVSQFSINPSYWKLDSEYLLSVSDPSQIHSSVYEFHFARRFCQIKAEFSGSLAFWTYFVQVKGRTALLAIDGIGKVTIDTDCLRVFDGTCVPFSCGKWYLWTVVKNTNTFQADTLTLYLNDQVVFESKVPKGCRIASIGSDGQINSHWYVAYGIQTSDAQFSAQRVREIYEEGYLMFNPEKPESLEISRGCQLVRYFGIRCFVKHFDVFNLILSSNSSEDVARLLHVAENLHQIRCIESSFFVNAIKYCVYEKRELCNKEIERFVSSPRFICDYHILSMGDCLFPDIEVIDEHLAVRVLDALTMFNLPPEKVVSFLSIIARYISIDPGFALKVLMVVEVLADVELVKSLLDVCFRHKDLVKEKISVARMFWVMTNSISWLDILEILSPDWYDISVIETHMAHFIRYVENRRMWVYLFRFLNNNRLDDIDPSASVQRPQLLPFICELLSRLIPVDEELSCEMISLLYSQLKQSGTVLFTVIDSLRILFSVGFGQQTPSEYPCNALGEDLPAPKVSPPGKIPGFDVKSDMIKILTTRWYKEIREYLTVSPDEINVVEFVERPTESFELNKAGTLVVSIASDLLFEISGDSLSFKQALGTTTIMGADVDREVVITMHRLIMMSFLERVEFLPSSSASTLFLFLAFRVAEGWWNDHILELFTTLQKLFIEPTAAVKFFVLSCLIHGESLFDVLLMFTSGPLFLQLMAGDVRFFCVYVEACLRPEVKSHQHFPDLKQAIIEKLPETDFGMALSKECESEWYQENPGIKTECREAINDLRKVHKEVLKNVATARNENTIRSNKVKYDSYYTYQETYKNWLNKAFRILRSIRINMECLQVDSVVARLQLVRSRQTKSDKYMLVHAPWPDVVPQKLVPKSYDYDIPESGSVTIPRSVHHNTLPLKDDFMDLARERKAAFCLRDYSLRPFAKCLISVLLKNRFNAVSSVFECSFMGSTELLRSVGVFSKEGFHMVLDASLDGKETVLHDTTSVICHLETLESIANGFYGKSASLFFGNATISVNFADVRLALPRRYTYRNIGLDIFTTQGHHLTILLPERERQQFLSKCKETKLDISLEQSSKKWVSRELGTLKYLMRLNIFGGRSFNDFSQYPVVPWVIGDYTSPEIRQMRDLERPIGAQTQEHIDRYLTVFKETGSNYHYGTHYSHPAAVLHFMVRVEPLTLYALNLHSGWDHKDRMFYDVSESWKSVYESKQLDTKELIPEFYCFPGIFENVNGLPLRNRSDGQPLSDVVLPPWAKNPLQFVWKMRSVLETVAVHKVNNWIDLIFGFKQRGHAAVEAMNCYHPCCYDTILKKKEDGDEVANEADKDAINNFGQCPIQLFTTAHQTAEPNERPTLGFSPANIVSTVLFDKGAEAVAVHSGKVFTTTSGRFPLRDGKFVTIGHGFVQVDNKFQEFFASAASVSQDSSLVVCGSANGLIRVFTDDLRHVATCIWNLNRIEDVIVSPKHYLICAYSSGKVALFDTSSERLMREHEFGPVSAMAFDDAANFLVIAGKTEVSVFGLDFRAVAHGNCDVPITSVVCGIPDLWHERPVFASGHVDGTVMLWKVDVYNETAVPEHLLELNACVRAMRFFHNNEALIAVSEDGAGKIAAVEKIGKKVVDPNLIPVCRICKDGLPPGSSVCSICGLPFCKNCRMPKNAKVCVACGEISTD